MHVLPHTTSSGLFSSLHAGGSHAPTADPGVGRAPAWAQAPAPRAPPLGGTRPCPSLCPPPAPWRRHRHSLDIRSGSEASRFPFHLAPLGTSNWGLYFKQTAFLRRVPHPALPEWGRNPGWTGAATESSGSDSSPLPTPRSRTPELGLRGGPRHRHGLPHRTSQNLGGSWAERGPARALLGRAPA